MTKPSVFNILFKSFQEKTNVNPVKMHPMNILTFIIITFLYYKAYEYLDGLRSCSCAPKDLSTLKNLEMFFIIWNALFIIVNMIDYLFNNNRTTQPIYKLFFAVYVFFFFAIQLFYIYNVYTYIYTTNNCDCMDNWQKYVLYFQSITYSLLPFLIVLFLFLFGFGPSILFIIVISSLIYYFVQQMSEQSFVKNS